MSIETISKVASDIRTDTVKVTGVVAQAIKDFEEAKASAKAAKTAQEAAEAIIREALGTATIGTYRGVNVVKVVGSSNSRVDSKLLAVAFPEAYAATWVSTPYTYLKGV